MSLQLVAADVGHLVLFYFKIFRRTVVPHWRAWFYSSKQEPLMLSTQVNEMLIELDISAKMDFGSEDRHWLSKYSHNSDYLQQIKELICIYCKDNLWLFNILPVEAVFALGDAV